MITVIDAALALLALQSGGEMKWQFQPEDQFDLKWIYAESRRDDNGSYVSEAQDRREIEGTLTFKSPGVLLIRLKKVNWISGTQDCDHNLTWVEGKPPVLQSRIKTDPKSTSFPGVQSQAQTYGDQMKKGLEGEYTVDTRKAGQTQIVWSGYGMPLFERIFIHPILPKTTFATGEVWKVPFDHPTYFSTGISSNTAPINLDHKITAPEGKDIVAKAGLMIPISPPPAYGQTISGSLTYAREWTFDRENYLQSSKEDVSLQKKTESKSPGSKASRSTNQHSIKQALTLKKKPPPPPPKPPEEPK